MCQKNPTKICRVLLSTVTYAVTAGLMFTVYNSITQLGTRVIRVNASQRQNH